MAAVCPEQGWVPARLPVSLLRLRATGAARQGLSKRLRSQTRDAHKATEMVFALEDRLADLTSYGVLLLALRTFHAVAEDALAAVAGWDGLRVPIDIGSRRRVALLDDDLGHLGIAVPAARRAWAGLPRLDSLASGLGCLYVLEGSALGGHVVARRARAVLGEKLPVEFFSSAGRADPGPTWRELSAALDAFSFDHAGACDGVVLLAARRTFGAFADCLAQLAPPR